MCACLMNVYIIHFLVYLLIVLFLDCGSSISLYVYRDMSPLCKGAACTTDVPL
jgi:hypothetical protein